MAIAIGLLKTLLELSRARKSGVIDAALEGARVRLFLEGGEIVAADAGTVGETLGRILVREKVLTEEQYAAAIEWMADIRSRGKNARLGEVFVELGMLTPQQVHAALSAQVQQKVVRALGWTIARTFFIECHGPLDVAARYPTSLEPLVLASLRLADEDEVEALFAQAKGRYIEVVEPERILAFELHTKEHEFARSLDGSRTASELLVAPDASEPAVILAALLLFDCLALHATARAPRRPSVPRPPPGIRRVAKGTAASAQPPPTPEKSGALPDAASSGTVRAPALREKERIRTIAARLRAAQEAKRAHGSRDAPYELAIPTPQTPVAPIARLLAEKAFQAGKNLVRANNMAQALVELRRATLMFPAAEYELWASWAALRVEGPSSERVDEVRRTAERALEQDPRLAFGWFVLGHLSMRDRDTTRANEYFKRARDLEPTTLDELRDVRLRDPTSSRSLVEAAKPPSEPNPDSVDAGWDSKEDSANVVAAPPKPASPKRVDTLPPTSFPKQARPLLRVPRPTSSARLVAEKRTTPAKAPDVLASDGHDVPTTDRSPSNDAIAEATAIASPQEEKRTDASPKATDEARATTARAKDESAERGRNDVRRTANAPNAPNANPAEPASGATSEAGARSAVEDPRRDAESSTREDGVPPTEPSAPELQAERRRADDPKPAAKADDPKSAAKARADAPKPDETANADDPKPDDAANADEAKPDEAKPDEAKTASDRPSSDRPPSIAKEPPGRAPRSVERGVVRENENGSPRWMPSRRSIAGAVIVAGLIVGVAWALGAFEPPVGPPATRVKAEPSARATSTDDVTATEADATDDADAIAIDDTDGSLDASFDGSQDASGSSSIELGSAQDASADVAVDAAVDGSSAVALASTDASAVDGSANDADLPAIAPTMGALTFPPLADGHRVYVDGRMVGAPPGAIVVPCGKHVVRVGSQGRDQDIDIPCGGRIAILYP